MTTAERDLLREAVRITGRQYLAAGKLGISPERFNRLVNGTARGHMSVRTCFRLAKLTHTPPQDVLRAAGKSDLADAIEEHYGPTKAVVTPPQDPLVTSLIEVLAQPNVDRVFVERILKVLKPLDDGTASTQQKPGLRRGRHR